MMRPMQTEPDTEQQKLLKNIQKNEVAAKIIFPNEQFVDASSLKLVQTGPDFEISENLENIKIAKSRITPSKNKKTISDNDTKTLAKELRQAEVLTSRGASVFIVPKMKDAQGRNIPGPDALVNGTLFEFKTITGALKRVETRFRESRDQGENVFIFTKVGLIPRTSGRKTGGRGICSPVYAKISRRNLQYPVIHGGDALFGL